jgi:hypothetical protein
MDMTAWVKAGTREEIGVITDFVDADLTNYFKRVTSEYGELELLPLVYMRNVAHNCYS